MSEFQSFSELAKKLRLAHTTGMHFRIDLDPDGALELAEILEWYEEDIRRRLEEGVAEFDRIIDEMETNT